MKKRVNLRNSRQQGLVMIAMLLLIFMAGTSMYFVAMSDRQGDVKKNLNYNHEMVLAKEALITYAANYSDFYPSENLGPGRLPCPDRNLNGRPSNNCHSSDGRRRNRLPRYAVLDEPNIDFFFTTKYSEWREDQSNEFSQFWYSVSADYVHDDAATVNSSVSGLLTLNGRSDYVAVIMAPGIALDGQDRGTDSEKDSRSNYLETPNNNSNDYVSLGNDPDEFNDKAIGITRKELMTAVTMRVAIEIKKELDDDYLNWPFSYPQENNYFWPALRYENYMDNEVIPDWYQDDDWDNQVTYNRISGSVATIQFQDCAIVYTLRYNANPEISRSSKSC